MNSVVEISEDELFPPVVYPFVPVLDDDVRDRVLSRLRVDCIDDTMGQVVEAAESEQGFDRWRSVGTRLVKEGIGKWGVTPPQNVHLARRHAELPSTSRRHPT